MEYIYGALLLHKLGQEVSEANLKKVIEATGAEVDESKVKTLIASLQGVDIASELENASAVAAAPAGGAAAGGDAPAEKKEEKKEEASAESAAGLSALFG
ncbi:MAG: 50S ribosomal protein P1 [Nanoarchaeota archaeon]|nr:50S ribosomal protein P1 [Nanoarchaeota archaeon]